MQPRINESIKFYGCDISVREVEIKLLSKQCHENQLAWEAGGREHSLLPKYSYQSSLQLWQIFEYK